MRKDQGMLELGIQNYQDQVIEELMKSEIMHELIRMKSAKIQTNLCEEIRRNEVREGESEGQEKRTHGVADDLMELEKVQKITNNARTCLGLIDQNMLRNVTVESKTILRHGT